LTTPCLINLTMVVLTQFGASWTNFAQSAFAKFKEGQGIEYLKSIHPSISNPYVWKIILSYMALQLFFLKALPCKKFSGPKTQTGHIPIYNANGFQAFVATFAVYFAGIYGGAFKGGFIADIMPEFIASMNIFSLIFCLVLYAKGHLFPSTKDSDSTGAFFFDYFAGVELYPRILGWDVKQFVNCRFGMMFWGIAPVSFAFKQYELNGFVSDGMWVSVILQLIYVAKFFYWETGYFTTIDIMHDRAGFMLIWGCCVWLPGLYTLPAHYLVYHPVVWGNEIAGAMLGLGIFAVLLNYLIDRQKEAFRAKDGKVTTFDKPATFIQAEYRTDDGKINKSKLLTSGWWGFARKFNYTLELSAAFLWCCPGGFTHVMPLLYFLFLVILLVDRAWRDDARCSAKYGAAWQEYKKKVPYMIIPFIF